MQVITATYGFELVRHLSLPASRHATRSPPPPPLSLHSKQGGRGGNRHFVRAVTKETHDGSPDAEALPVEALAMYCARDIHSLPYIHRVLSMAGSEWHSIMHAPWIDRSRKESRSPCGEHTGSEGSLI
jgi:hypothetical protein